MARIIAGSAGSIPLKRPASATRPTTDRVRESLFGKLESLDAIAGRTVLDLFAGTGALALEALSRGAESATLVEQNRAAAKVVEENIALVGRAIEVASGAAPKTRLVIRDTARFLAGAEAAGYDLVFIDPPYEFGDDRLAQLLTALQEKLAPGAVVVIERGKLSSPLVPTDYRELFKKDYGDTRICILRREA